MVRACDEKRGEYVGRRAVEMKVQRRSKRGRPKRMWLGGVRNDIKEKGLSAEEVYECATYKEACVIVYRP